MGYLGSVLSIVLSALAGGLLWLGLVYRDKLSPLTVKHLILASVSVETAGHPTRAARGVGPG